MVHCANGDANECEAVVLTVPIPLLREIVLPPPEREKAAHLLRISALPATSSRSCCASKSPLVAPRNRKDLADLTFLLSGCGYTGLVDAAPHRSPRAHWLVRRSEERKPWRTSPSMN